MNISLIEYPMQKDWDNVYLRALVTVHKDKTHSPSDKWKHQILEARHSPIRYMRFSFLLEDIPYWVSVHLCRHIHAQPYVQTQRNDRQSEYDRTDAPQNQPITMIYDVNAEELMVIANKRLCHKASPETREVVKMMCNEVIKVCPEFKDFLVPMCIYNGGVCHEFGGRCDKADEYIG